MKHKGSDTRQAGGVTREQAIEIKAFKERATKKVACQRLFVEGKNSRYNSLETQEQAEPPHAEDMGIEMTNAWDDAAILEAFIREGHRLVAINRKRQVNLIQSGAPDEVNPWLRRAGWIDYLKDCLRVNLASSVVEPSKELLEDSTLENFRRIDMVIWNGMRNLAKIAQKTTAASSQFVRIEVIQTSVTLDIKTPMQVYFDQDSIEVRARPWQQILMFFLRTQRDHDWTSPKYCFEPIQQKCFKEMVDIASAAIEQEANNSFEDDHDLPPLELAILKFCIELLNHRAKESEWDLPLVCASAVLGVGYTEMPWHTPETYPPILSRIMKIARMMIIQWAKECCNTHRQDANRAEKGMIFDDCSDSGYDTDLELPQVSRLASLPQNTVDYSSVLSLVRQMTRSFMVHGTDSPSQWFQDLLSYGLSIHWKTTSIGHVTWRDNMTLEYQAMAFTMHQFRSMVHTLRKTTKQQLFERVLLVNADEYSSVPAVPWQKIYDNPSNATHGWSFLDDPRTELPQEAQNCLSNRMKECVRQNRLVENGVTSKAKMIDWLRAASDFRAKLLVLMHMTGGQPARGPEILSLRHKNTANGAHRNIFIEDGHVVFVTQYHKGYHASGEVKVIHRYLPREVGELLILYLWLVVPVVQAITAKIGESVNVSDHLWPVELNNTKWSTARLSNEIKKVSQEHLGVAEGMGVAAYRQIAIAIGRKFMRESALIETDPEDLGLDADEEAFDQQAGHSSRTAGMIYGRESHEQFGVIADRRRLYRKASVAWHQVLGFESIDNVNDDNGTSAFSQSASREREARQKKLRMINPDKQFAKMMNADVAFRSKQADSMKAVLRGRSQILSVMRTGAGKSILFMLPAWIAPRGMTIVVLPLIALRDDMMRRCRDLSIDSAVWNDRGTDPDGATVVLVTPEMSLKPEFMGFIRRVKASGQLDRIVIDECHMILNKKEDFRNKLQQLGRLGLAETQMVLLTATLPPSEEGNLLERMYWNREDVDIIRDSTVRKNIAYSVIDPGGRSIRQRLKSLEDIVKTVLAKERIASGRGKVVVMCENVKHVLEIVDAQPFPCHGYFAAMSRSEKELTMKDFREGKVRVLVATGAFGMGIDIPNIRAVIHYDDPRSMLDFAQASGRGGRDGQRAYSVILSGGATFQDDSRMVEYLRGATSRCRRIMLDNYLDGTTTRSGCQQDQEEEICDVCGGRQLQEPAEEMLRDPITSIEEDEFDDPGFDWPVWQKAAQQVEEREETERRTEVREERVRARVASDINAATRLAGTSMRVLGERLDEWKKRCVLCAWRGIPDRHLITRCNQPLTLKLGVGEKVDYARRHIVLDRTEKFCFGCQVPMDLRAKWTTGERNPNVDCQYMGVLLGITIGVRYGDSLWWKVKSLSREDLDKEDQELLICLARKSQNGMSNLINVFLELTKRIAG